MFIADTPDKIRYFRLASVKGMLKLESKGLKGRGGALRPRLAEFGLKPRDGYVKYITYIEKELEKVRQHASS
jgi:hypothetical protein